MESPPSDKRPVLVIQRALAKVLSWARRVLGSIYQIVFRDQLGNISRQTERLGAASVESVTHLGGEVRALDRRLAAIERELAALRALLEDREGSGADQPDGVTVRPPDG